MLPISIFGTLFLLIPLIVAVDFNAWMTTPTTTARALLALTAGVALLSPPVVHGVYTNCWRNEGNGRKFIYEYQCAVAVSRAVAAFAVGSMGLGYATGWYKREPHEVNYVKTTDMNGNLVYHVDLSHPLSKRSDGADSNMTTFSFANITLSMPTDFAGKYLSDFVGVTFGELNDTQTKSTMPAHVVRYSNNAGMRMDFILPKDDMNKRDLDPGNGYYTTGGSMVLECQYTLGAGEESGVKAADKYVKLLELAGEGRLLHWRMVEYHGYIGPTSRLKCASKVYSHTETHDSWGEDVWSLKGI